MYTLGYARAPLFVCVFALATLLTPTSTHAATYQYDTFACKYFNIVLKPFGGCQQAPVAVVVTDTTVPAPPASNSNSNSNSNIVVTPVHIPNDNLPATTSTDTSTPAVTNITNEYITVQGNGITQAELNARIDAILVYINSLPHVVSGSSQSPVATRTRSSGVDVDLFNKQVDKLFESMGDRQSALAESVSTEALTVSGPANLASLTIVNTGSGSSFFVGDEANDTTPFVIDASGNVGIGTTSPASRLHISGSDTSGVGVIALVENTATATISYARFLMRKAGIDYGSFFAGGAYNPYGIVNGMTLSPGSTTQDIGFRTGAQLTGGGAGPSMIIKASGNVGIGTTSPNNLLQVAGLINFNDTTFSTSLGKTAGASLTTGFRNTAVGFQAMLTATSSIDNTAIGYRALRANTTGSSNTANGINALLANTTGNSNTANGANALLANTTGNSNTANGLNALQFNTTGNSNTANGATALRFNTTGAFNTALGMQAGLDINTANNTGNNTVIGYNTGRGITTGVNNTILGANVTDLTAGLSNNIIIADGTGNQRINVGSTGNVGIGTTTLTSKLTIQGTAGQSAFSVASSTGASLLTVAANGNVGIGTSTPANPVTAVQQTNNNNPALYAFNPSRDLSATFEGRNNSGAFLEGFAGINIINNASFTARRSGIRMGLSGVDSSVILSSITHDEIIATGQPAVSGYGDFIIGTRSSAGMTEKVRVTSSGNVGIGTASPTNILSLGNTAAQKFWIENTASGIVGRALTLAAGGTIAGGTDITGGGLILQSGLGTGAGASTLSFQTGTTLGTGTTLQTMSTKMTILGNGNVGIGTAAPDALLHLSKPMNGSSDTSPFLRISSSNNMDNLSTNPDMLQISATAGNVPKGNLINANISSNVNTGAFTVANNINGNAGAFTQITSARASNNSGYSSPVGGVAPYSILGVGASTTSWFDGGTPVIGIGVNLNISAWGGGTPGYRSVFGVPIKIRAANPGAVSYGVYSDVAGAGTNYAFYAVNGQSYFADNVGIGETAPGSRLSVSGGGSFGSGYDTTAAPTNGLIVQGNVGIGTTTPGSRLTVAGSIFSTDLLGGVTTLSTDANGNIIRTPSDERLKTDVSQIDNALDAILALRGVRYEWLDKERFGDVTELGFLAQEVDMILPELVRKEGEYWSLNTPNMLAVVVEAMKEMWAKIIGLEEKMEEIDELRERIEQLETERGVVPSTTPAPPPVASTLPSPTPTSTSSPTLSSPTTPTDPSNPADPTESPELPDPVESDAAADTPAATTPPVTPPQTPLTTSTVYE